MDTQIKFQKDNKGNISDVVITNVGIYYCNIRSPRPIYDDRKLAYNKARKEYSVEVAVSEEVADSWDEVFTKQPSKKYTNAKFMEKYKLDNKEDLPFPNEKKQFTIKIVQKAQNKDGEPVPDFMIPRVFVIKDKKAVDVTFDTNVGNGSKGAVKLRVNANDYGTFAYLSRVKVDELVEYEGGGSGEADKDFLGVDDVELAEAPERKPSKASDDDQSDDNDEDNADPDDF